MTRSREENLQAEKPPAEKKQAGNTQALDQLAALYASEESEDQRSLRYSLAVAFVLHLALLFTAIPTLQQTEAEPAAKPKVLKLTKTPRFRPPPPPPPERQKPRQKVTEIPVPDRDPDHDEFVPDEPDVEIPLVEEPDIWMPTAPPVVEADPVPDGPIRVGGRVSPPERTFYVQPEYPPMARRTRIEGKVVLEATIDTRGHVIDLRVVKDQPMGLSQAAVDAVSKWRFKPSKLGDTLVPVLYRVEVDFTLH